MLKKLIALLFLCSGVSFAFSFTPYIPSTSTYQGDTSVINIASGTVRVLNVTTGTVSGPFTVQSSSISVNGLQYNWPATQTGNRFLETDGSGHLAWGIPPGAGTINAGTNGQVPYYTGSTTLSGSSNLNIWASSVTSPVPIYSSGSIAGAYAPSSFVGAVISTTTGGASADSAYINCNSYVVIVSTQIPAGNWMLYAHANANNNGASGSTVSVLYLSTDPTGTSDLDYSKNLWEGSPPTSNYSQSQDVIFPVALTTPTSYYVKENVSCSSGQIRIWATLNAVRLP